LTLVIRKMLAARLHVDLCRVATALCRPHRSRAWAGRRCRSRTAGRTGRTAPERR